ncbi:uncharacterized protein BO88DRAFT_412175 [Aspergillus vadensis CBS 113365]|uniref:Uncharacterized protein n=1 Tax=Aspergillus vadensis (strain CBS 113365 / IMI 142717 / IBT 24658) TaxID=1448311 RepID=A0A319BJG9_ASPVC|nr:hypothetical protein BO88DRAFT_412175 [Aspergillus vadensis CBS 113365]PYH72049.1 hypothetical protein BO88DRAFT_412175 [Aspergillus vadensis CBS 113365]
MQVTKYFLATAIALSSSVLAAIDTVDISYTSNGVLHNQTITSGVITLLDYPGLITTFQANSPCNIFHVDPLQGGTQVDEGAHTYDPGFNATSLICINSDQL